MLILFIAMVSIANAQYVKKAVIGGSVQLPCRADRHTLIEWRKKTVFPFTLIVSENMPTYTYRNKVYLTCSYEYRNLTIMELTLADSGQYTCKEQFTNNTYNEIKLLVVNRFNDEY